MLHINIIGIVFLTVLALFWFWCARRTRKTRKFVRGCFRFFGGYNALMAVLLLGATLMP